MFRIDSNQAIRISRGDDVYFPLFLNKGTVKAPIRYPMQPEGAMATTSYAALAPVVDAATFGTKVDSSGTYTFTYATDHWTFNQQTVVLETYGIMIAEGVTPRDGDFIIITYQKAGNEKVIFYVFHPNQPWERAIFAKEFVPTTANVNDNHDLVLSLDSSDTINIPEGEYRYVIRAYLKDAGSTGSYSWNTVTNRLPFIVVDDDYRANFIYR